MNCPPIAAIGALEDWISSNWLHLKAQKSRILLVGYQATWVARLYHNPLSAEYPTMYFSLQVRDLWVLLDTELTFVPHNNYYRSGDRICYYKLKLRVIAPSLTFKAEVSLVHAFVFSRFDYCGSIFAGLPQVQMERLRRATEQLRASLAGLQYRAHNPQERPSPETMMHFLPCLRFFPSFRKFFRLCENF